MTIPDLPFDPSLLPDREGVFLVGGTTRDLLLGILPADYDIAVSRNPEKFARLTADRNRGRLIRMGRPGKRSFRVLAGPTIMDITGLNGPTITHDLENRDITINAMAIDLASGTLVDSVGGQRDLAEKRIRMVSGNSFAQDPIRLLRVFRLAAVLGFSVEAQTLSAISRDAGLIHLSAGERIRSELHGLFSCRKSFPFLLEMAGAGLLTSIFPELIPFRHSGSREGTESLRLDHLLSTYEALENLLCSPPPGFSHGEMENRISIDPGQFPWLKCAALLHHVNGPAAAADTCHRLRLSLKEQRLITDIVSHHGVPRHLYERFRRKTLDPLAVTRFFMAGNAHTPHLLLHALADAESGLHGQPRNGNAFSDFLQQLLHAYYETHLTRKAQPPLVTGRDLMTALGLSPSPIFKTILSRLEEERLAGDLTDRKSALRRAREIMRAQQF
jgi:poly(A) polymerase